MTEPLLLGKDAKGNVLVASILVITILSLFGTLLVSRMIVDTNASAKKLIALRAFYLADSGIQWGRKYLVAHDSDTSLGPLTIGGGRVTVVIEDVHVLMGDDLRNTRVWNIKSTATVGNTTRVVEELRDYDDKNFLAWREAVADEF